jgi:gamma-glutamylcyclotransferase (GGCT)/AIG2-like uncharacterized protein YtfP
VSRLFAYGTLLVAEVMERVAGRSFPAEHAVLLGWRRRLLRGATYPGLVPAPGESVEGLLYAGLDAGALARIDRFEGALYERRELTVALDSGKSRPAFVYVLRPEHRGLLSELPWSEAEFRARHLRDPLV